MSQPFVVRRLLVGVALASVATGACASGGGGRSAAEGRQSDVIYRSEIAKSSALNAYDAVRLLRPAFLAGRGPTSLLRTREGSNSPMVYVDNQRFGDSSSLRNIPIDGIVEIRFVGATQAQLRWGMDHPAGAILVLTGNARRTVP